MKITFRQLDAFRTVVSTGSVTDAAALLGISQPAVSRLVSDLEAELGFDLFQRLGRVLVPTDEARLLVDEVRQSMAGLEHVKQAAAAIGKFAHARLNLIATPALSSQVAPELIGRFARTRPDSMAQLETEPNSDVIEWKVAQSFDFGLMNSDVTNPAFESHVICHEDAYCVLPRGHALTGKPLVQARDLVAMTFISYMPGTRFRHEIDAFFQAKGIARHLQYEARSTDAICRLVAQGLGVSVVGGSCRHLQAVPGCIARPFAAPLAFKAVLFWAKARPLSAVARDFMQLVQDGADSA